MEVDPEGPMSAGRSEPLGVANSNGHTRPGGGVWMREQGDLFRPAECPWHPGQSKEAGGWLVAVGAGGRDVRQLPPLGRQRQYLGEVHGGPSSPSNLLSGLPTGWGNERGRQCSN